MVPRDPSSCRGWIAFRVGPHFSGPSARRELLRHRAGCAQRSLPVPSTLQRCPILGGSEGRFRPRQGRACRYAATVPRGRMGARVMASGMPGVSRRAVLGGATYSVVKVWVRLRGAGRPAAASLSAPHPWRASSAGGGVNPSGHCARGYSTAFHVPLAV